jgi:hypothetical protein
MQFCWCETGTASSADDNGNHGSACEWEVLIDAEHLIALNSTPINAQMYTLNCLGLSLVNRHVCLAAKLKP